MNKITLSKHLRRRSEAICSLNGCTEDDHRCESYAYINAQCHLLDICASDYWQGSSASVAAIPLPWRGTQAKLEKEVRYQIAEEKEIALSTKKQ